MAGYRHPCFAPRRSASHYPLSVSLIPGLDFTTPTQSPTHPHTKTHTHTHTRALMLLPSPSGAVLEVRPDAVVMDSINTVYLGSLPQAPGTVTQVRQWGCV